MAALRRLFQLSRKSARCWRPVLVCSSWNVGLNSISSLNKLTKQSFTGIKSSCYQHTTACMLHQDSFVKTEFKKTVQPVTDYQNIYIFRYIVHTRVLSRLKIYQTLLTTVAIPPCLYFYNVGVLLGFEFAAILGIASLATVMLYVMSNFFRRVVGIISFNPKENTVRISHLTFWGRRYDETFSLSEIVPLSDMPLNPHDIYLKIRFYDKPNTFYWFHHHGQNTNTEVLEAIFGKLSA